MLGTNEYIHPPTVNAPSDCVFVPSIDVITGGVVSLTKLYLIGNGNGMPGYIPSVLPPASDAST